MLTGVHEGLEPILPGTAPSDYERYLRTDELLSLQKTPEEWNHRDELLFQTVHQTSELWLKLACSEVDEAIEAEPAQALRTLGRAALCIRYVIDATEMLERMSPWEFHRGTQPARSRRGVRLARLPAPARAGTGPLGALHPRARRSLARGAVRRRP